MRSPRTANDDQPGPIGRRHNATGGVCDQSVSISNPRTMPSRFGPRKPGHSARFFAGAGVGDAPSPSAAASAGFGAVAAGGAATSFWGAAGAEGAGLDAPGIDGGGAMGSSLARESRISSGDGVHRQLRSELPSPTIPAVRTSVNDPHARRIAATSVARRNGSEKARLTTAQVTSARHSTGME